MKKSPLPILFVFVVVDLLGFSLILLLGTFAGFACFLILGLARSLVLVFASRILNGLLGGNISLAQAYITDVTDEKSRARSLGIIGAAFGIGFVIGPALGGLLSSFGYGVPALAAAAPRVPLSRAAGRPRAHRSAGQTSRRDARVRRDRRHAPPPCRATSPRGPRVSFAECILRSCPRRPSC